MKQLMNAPIYVVAYVLFMLPTYYFPYIGSNSSALNAVGVAANAGLNPAFYWHLIALLILVALGWFRGSLINKKWLVVFPVLALIFDLTPGLSVIPLVPTVMHLLAIILGVAGVAASSPSLQSPS